MFLSPARDWGLIIPHGLMSSRDAMACKNRGMTVRDLLIYIYIPTNAYESAPLCSYISIKGPDYCQMKAAWSRLMFCLKR